MAERGEEGRDPGAEELPDGFIPLPRERDPRAGCRVTGCLYGMVILFAVLLIVLVIGLAVRMWITPAMPRM
jgi:hypothetical protein